jgi:hypothetical protein
VGYTRIDVIPAKPRVSPFAQRRLDIGVEFAEVMEHCGSLDRLQ